MSYQQLTEGQRYQFSALLSEGYSQAGIARTIGAHPSNISRELARNGSEKGYEPELAQQLTTNRKKSAAKYKVSQTAVIFAELMLEHQWSSEQISNVRAMIGLALSHEWIYQYVAQDKANGASSIKTLGKAISVTARESIRSEVLFPMRSPLMSDQIL